VVHGSRRGAAPLVRLEAPGSLQLRDLPLVLGKFLPQLGQVCAAARHLSASMHCSVAEIQAHAPQNYSHTSAQSACSQARAGAWQARSAPPAGTGVGLG